ncbi:MAG: Chemotaxis protein CheW [Candidatus Dichloromethanomonas elyunquensis]|nr:MAG: Chemotaxis protein CheW [Candidatus Dichloromethanomonas elyunquensis]
MGFQIVVFSLGSEEYGLPIEAVQEITRLAEVHPIPKAPDFVKGLIRIRGQAIPLIDLHQKFSVQSENEPEFAVITEIDGNLIGFAVEEVKEVRAIEDVSPPPPLVHSSFIGGIVNLPDRMIIQVIPERILEEQEVDHLNRLVG